MTTSQASFNKLVGNPVAIDSMDDIRFSPLTVEDKIITLKALYVIKGYTFFDGNKPYNLNIIGWRLMNRPNRFDDEIWLVYRNDKLEWQIDRMTGTTKPGPVYLNAPLNPNGCAIIKEGQYRSVWVLGSHKGKPALRQQKPFIIYRDNDNDESYDLHNEQSSNNGTLHLHKMCNATVAPRVNSWSAGCQGLNNPVQYVKAFEAITKSANLYGDSFSYTLFDLVYGV